MPKFKVQNHILSHADDAPIIKGRPKDWTEEDQEIAVAWFATLPLKELRKRQSFNNMQTIHAAKLYDTPAYEGSDVAKDSFADLEMIRDLLMDAVGRQTFGKDWNVKEETNV